MLSVTEDKYFIKDLVCFLLIMFHKLSSANALLLLLKLNLKSCVSLLLLICVIFLYRKDI